MSQITTSVSSSGVTTNVDNSNPEVLAQDSLGGTENLEGATQDLGVLIAESTLPPEEKEKLYERLLNDLKTAFSAPQIQEKLAYIEPSIPMPTAEDFEDVSEYENSERAKENRSDRSGEQRLRGQLSPHEMTQAFKVAKSRLKEIQQEQAEHKESHQTQKLKNLIQNRLTQLRQHDTKTTERKSVEQGFSHKQETAADALAKLLGVKETLSPFNQASSKARKADTKMNANAEQADTLENEEIDEAFTGAIGGDTEYGEAESPATSLKDLKSKAERHLAQGYKEKAVAEGEQAHKSEAEFFPPSPQDLELTLTKMIGVLIKADGTVFTKQDADSVSERLLLGAGALYPEGKKTRSNSIKKSLTWVQGKNAKSGALGAQTMSFGARCVFKYFDEMTLGRSTSFNEEDMILLGNGMSGQATTAPDQGDARRYVKNITQQKSSTFEDDTTLEDHFSQKISDNRPQNRNAVTGKV